MISFRKYLYIIFYEKFYGFLKIFPEANPLKHVLVCVNMSSHANYGRLGIFSLALGTLTLLKLLKLAHVYDELAGCRV